MSKRQNSEEDLRRYVKEGRYGVIYAREENRTLVIDAEGNKLGIYNDIELEELNKRHYITGLICKRNSRCSYTIISYRKPTGYEAELEFQSKLKYKIRSLSKGNDVRVEGDKLHIMYKGKTLSEGIDRYIKEYSGSVYIYGVLPTDSSYLCKGYKSREIHFEQIEGSEGIELMRGMFEDCRNLESLDISALDTKKVKDMRGIFKGCVKLRELKQRISTESCIDLSEMYRGCSKLEYIDVTGYRTSKAETMAGMFEDCSSLQSLQLGNFDTSNVRSLARLFKGCKELKYVSMYSFRTPDLVDMTGMFEGCELMQSIDLHTVEIEKVKSMDRLFAGCKLLERVIWNEQSMAKRVESCEEMFKGCESITAIQLNRIDLWEKVGIEGIIDGCKSLRTVYVTERFYRTWRLQTKYAMKAIKVIGQQVEKKYVIG